jgi:Icc-related predicted phosphoesterase
MKLCIISDTHNKHKHLGVLPEADVIIHCGDFTSVGKEHEVENFMKWFSKLDQYKYKIIIAGNHDWLFEKNGILARDLVPKNVIYLEDNEAIIEGFKFYGTPVQKRFCDWAFNRDEHILQKHWNAIPDDVDVLITHETPYTILDYVPWSNKHEGSASLYSEVVGRIKPMIHCFGHIHEGYGIRIIGDIRFINASNLNGDYECVNAPVIEIIKKPE